MTATFQVQEGGRRLVEGLAGMALEARDLPELEGAVGREMARLGIALPAAYFAHLESGGGGEDRTRLLDLVVNNETYFFRERQHFVTLRELLRGGDSGRDRAAGQRIRVLSAGCSTGEEAYSLAIDLLALREQVPELDFEVLGVDISRRALQVAREGVYGPNSFRRLPDDLDLEARLEPAGDGTYAVPETVRHHVAFHHLNLAEAGSVAERLGRMDVVFFRNVLIYLGGAARLEACRNLAAALRRPGYLFMGAAEILPAQIGGLRRRRGDGVYFWEKEDEVAHGPSTDGRQPKTTTRAAPARRPGTAGTAPAATPALRGPDPEPPQDVATQEDAARQKDVEPLYEEALAHARQDRPQEALELLRRVVAVASDHLPAQRMMAELHLDRAELEAAVQLSDRATARDVTLAWPYVLRGRVAHSQGVGAEAVAQLRTAIYHQPDCWPAHFFLAEAYRIRGETPLARRSYANALRNLEKGMDPGQDCGVDLMGFSREDIATTCRLNLQARP